jgi:cytochrome c551/c552
MNMLKSLLAACCLLLAQSRTALADEALAARSGCLECHSVDAKKIGPAYRDVATRYRSDPRAPDLLREKVRKGGKGNWTNVTGGVPMPPFSALLSEDEIRALVSWVLAR